MAKRARWFRGLKPLYAIYGKIIDKANIHSGREYGTASLPIHIKSCKTKWEIEQEKLPVKQRRPLPQPPQNFNEVRHPYSINAIIRS